MRADLTEEGKLSSQTVQEIKERVEKDGFCSLCDAFDASMLESYRAEFEAAWLPLKNRLREAAVDQDRVFRFRELCSRKSGRYEVASESCGGSFQAVQRVVEKVLRPLFEHILGPDAVVHQASVITNQPGSEAQHMHRDGPHLFSGTQLPPHALQVFLPLVAMTEDNGPTHFKPGSHLHESQATGADVALPTVTSWPGIGSCNVWDYRTLHNGQPNLSPHSRPVMAFTVAKPWWKDDRNAFPSCSVYDPNPGQGDVPTRLQESVFDPMALLDCDPCLGDSDTESAEEEEEPGP